MQHTNLLHLLNSEIKPALGCTEPAAVAFAVAKAVKYLGGEIEKVRVTVSGNIVKNAMAVIIPNTGESGLQLASALGMLKGDPEKELQIFDDIEPRDIEKAHEIIAQGKVFVELAEEDGIYIEVKVTGNKGLAEVYIAGGHTRVVKAVVNGETVFSLADFEGAENKAESVDIRNYTIAELVDAIETLPLDKLVFLLNGMEMNLLTAEKGLELNAGLGVGAGMKLLMDRGIVSQDIVNKARMFVAAACDARMAGLNYPIMSSMGSGNHGIEAILPVAVVAEELKSSKEKVVRALALSHLVTAFVKQHTGKLSAICGCSVAAGAGATAAITWLMEGTCEQIGGSIKNIIGNLAGMICDGAKGGCALKLATSAGEAIISAQLALKDIIISPQDGIIAESAEETIRNLGMLSTFGMTCTEETILNIMMEKENKVVGL